MKFILRNDHKADVALYLSKWGQKTKHKNIKIKKIKENLNSIVAHCPHHQNSSLNVEGGFLSSFKTIATFISNGGGSFSLLYPPPCWYSIECSTVFFGKNCFVSFCFPFFFWLRESFLFLCMIFIFVYLFILFYWDRMQLILISVYVCVQGCAPLLLPWMIWLFNP